MQILVLYRVFLNIHTRLCSKEREGWVIETKLAELLKEHKGKVWLEEKVSPEMR